MKKCLDIIVATLMSRNFIVSLIMSDGEGGAIGKLVPYLERLSIEVNISGAGGHVAKTERRIRVSKERIRWHICGRLPFTLTINGLSMLALYCISRLNYQHSGTRPGGATPREAFSGQRVAGNRDSRVAFGDYCQCTVVNTDHSMNPRTEDCIAYLPRGTRAGSVTMLSLKTNKQVVRDDFVVLPMPESVILLLNRLAAKDGRYPSKTPNVYDEIQYMHSVDKSSMPRFMTVAPPNAELTQEAQAHYPVLADTPIVGIIDSIFPPEIGESISGNILELHPEDNVQGSPPDNYGASADTSQYKTDTLDSGAAADPNGETSPPSTLPLSDTINHTDTTAEDERARSTNDGVI